MTRNEWCKRYFRDGGTVRSLIYGEISDTSKSVWGFRDRFDPTNVRLLDLWHELKRWYRRAEESVADYEAEQRLEEEKVRLETQMALVMPTELCRIADQLEK